MKKGMTMKKKNRIIITLIVIAVILFCTIYFFIIPTIERKQTVYEFNQQNALTHDITVIENYKTPYLGNATNVSGLFEQLPLSNVEKKYEIDSEKCTLTVIYLDTVWNIGEQKVHQDLVYNAVAAMASIDNLSMVTYAFPEYDYSFTRAEMEDAFGESLSSLLDKEIWKAKVQDKIADNDFLNFFRNGNRAKK